MITADCHLHTSFSSDSKAVPSDVVESAIAKGLKTICITDHMDAEYPHIDFGSFVFDLKEYTNELEQLKETYRNKIQVLIGIEFGLRNEPEVKSRIRDYYQKLTESYPFDYCIGSTHVMNNYDPYVPLFWEHRTLKDGLTDYFESIIHNAAYYKTFQCYGHLDYIVRYNPSGKKDYCPNDYADLIDTMLTTIIHAGKGIECNTSGLKFGLGFTHPKVELIKRYKELGGEIITIGSDAHKPEHVAYDFKAAQEMLESIGFRYYTLFEQQKPQFIPF